MSTFFSKFFLEINSIDRLFMAQKNIFLQLSFLYLPGMHSKRRRTFFIFQISKILQFPDFLWRKKLLKIKPHAYQNLGRLLGGDEHFIFFIFSVGSLQNRWETFNQHLKRTFFSVVAPILHEIKLICCYLENSHLSNTEAIVTIF